MYPALAVLQTLKDKPVTVLWVGGEGGMEAELVQRAGLQFRAIAAAGVHGVGLRRLPGNLARLARGYRQARQILKEFQPDVLFFTGGYLAPPVAWAGRHLPSLLYVPDIEPGLALKTLARLAGVIAVTAEESRRYFPRQARLVVTGYPTRPDLRAWDLAQARQVLGLTEDLPVLLVFGGSKGARSINRALLEALPQLLPEMQVVHISGQLDWPEVERSRRALPDRLSDPVWAGRYHAFPYLHDEMGAALTAADLVVARAGASTLGEFPLFGLPAVLVPYPHAWRYQYVNAQYLVERQAAVLLPDAELPTRLAAVVLKLMHDPAQREKMRHSMRAFQKPEAAAEIGKLLLDLPRLTKTERKTP